MRKNVFGRQFKRDRNERKALFKSLLSSLVIYERIQTTEAKAKAIKADADKLITKAKKSGLHAYKLIEPKLTAEAAKKLFEQIAPRFSKRQGGYTRIIRTANRLKDNAAQVILEWTEKPEPIKPKTEEAADAKTAEEVIEGSRNPIGKLANKLIKKSDKKENKTKEKKGKTK